MLLYLFCLFMLYIKQCSSNGLNEEKKQLQWKKLLVWSTMNELHQGTFPGLSCLLFWEQHPVHVINVHVWFIAQGFYSHLMFFFSHLILAVVTDHFGPQSTQSPLWRKTVCGGRRKTHDMVVPLINVISSIRDHQKLFRFHIGFPVLPGCAAVCDAHHCISNNSLHIYKAHSWW